MSACAATVAAIVLLTNSESLSPIQTNAIACAKYGSTNRTSTSSNDRNARAAVSGDKALWLETGVEAQKISFAYFASRSLGASPPAGAGPPPTEVCEYNPLLWSSVIKPGAKQVVFDRPFPAVSW